MHLVSWEHDMSSPNWCSREPWKGFECLGHSNWTICRFVSSFCPQFFPPFYTASHIKPNVPITKGFECLGHLNWTICRLVSWFCPQFFPPFYTASHNKPIVPILITQERGWQKTRKGNSPKLDEKHGFECLGHSNWTIWRLVSWFGHISLTWSLWLLLVTSGHFGHIWSHYWLYVVTPSGPEWPLSCALVLSRT